MNGFYGTLRELYNYRTIGYRNTGIVRGQQRSERLKMSRNGLVRNDLLLNNWKSVTILCQSAC